MNNSEGQTQEPVGGMDENIISKIIQAQIGTPNQSNVIENHMADYFKRFASYKDKFTELEWYHIFLDFYDAVQDATPPPAEGEDEINLLKETINNQHALILSAEQRGYEKAKEEFSAPPSPDVEALAEKYANGIIPNPNSKDAPYYTTGNVWDEISDAFKAGYSASLPQSSTEEENDLHKKNAELMSLRQSIIESKLADYFPKKEISFHDKVVLAIAAVTEQPTVKPDEENGLWVEVKEIFMKHYDAYNYPSQAINELQSKFKIFKI